MQLAERIYMKENKLMADLCRKQTTVYNLAMFLYRQQFFAFGGKVIDPTNIIDLENGVITTMPKKRDNLTSIEDDLKIELRNKRGKTETHPVYPAFFSSGDLNNENMLRWKQCYRDAIPGCAAETIKRMCDGWTSYWKSLKEWKTNPHGFTGKPKFPGFVEGNCIHVKNCQKAICNQRDDEPSNDIDIKTGKISPRQTRKKCPDFVNATKSPIYFTYGQFYIKDHYVIFPTITGFDPLPVPRLNDQKRSDSNAPVKQIRIIPAKNGGYWIECVYDIKIIPMREKIQQLLGIPELPECTIEALKGKLKNIDKKEKSQERKNKKRGITTDEKTADTTVVENAVPLIKNLRIMAIDLNLNRVVMIVTSDSVGTIPIGISGGPIKSINQLYNKTIKKLQADRSRHDPRIAVLQQKLDRFKKASDELGKLNKENPTDPRTDVLRVTMADNALSDAEWREHKQRTCYTKRMKAITKNKNNRVAAYFHRVSRFVINEALKLQIDVIIMGHNKLQKQNINLGKRTNQNFVQMPVFKLIDEINYKAELANIVAIEIPEDYTTQSSFCDDDPIPTLIEFKANPVQFSGHRISRKKKNEYIDPKTGRKIVEYWKSRMYETANGTIIHGDVNDAYNIMRKAFPDAVKAEGIAGVRLHPRIQLIPAS